MKIIRGLTKIALSPLNGVKEVITDSVGDNGEEKQGLSVLSVGTLPMLRGTVKGIIDGFDDLTN